MCKPNEESEFFPESFRCLPIKELSRVYAILTRRNRCKKLRNGNSHFHPTAFEIMAFH